MLGIKLVLRQSAQSRYACFELLSARARTTSCPLKFPGIHDDPRESIWLYHGDAVSDWLPLP